MHFLLTYSKLAKILVRDSREIKEALLKRYFVKPGVSDHSGQVSRGYRRKEHYEISQTPFEHDPNAEVYQTTVFNELITEMPGKSYSSLVVFTVVMGTRLLIFPHLQNMWPYALYYNYSFRNKVVVFLVMKILGLKAIAWSNYKGVSEPCGFKTNVAPTGSSTLKNYSRN